MNAPYSIDAENLKRLYRRGPEEIPAVNDVSLRVEKGTFLSVVGPSGSGKTTLINVLGCLDNPTSGRLSLGGRVVFENGKVLSEAKLTRFRRDVFGYIFQKFYLVSTLTVLENVVLPFTFFKKTGCWLTYDACGTSGIMRPRTGMTTQGAIGREVLSSLSERQAIVQASDCGPQSLWKRWLLDEPRAYRRW